MSVGTTTCFLVALLCAPPTAASRETEWAKYLAPKYEAAVEVALWDKTRCDLVTATEAIEVDWAPKWAEAIGQSQYYATVLHLEPAIILLVRDPVEERRFVYRCQTVCAKLGMRLYVEVTK